MKPTVTMRTCAEHLAHKGVLNTGITCLWPLNPRRLFIAEIQQAVADHFQLPMREMTSQRKSRDIVRPRQIAMFLCKLHTNRSYPYIGDRFGNRDHTTVMHAIKQIEKFRSCDPEMALAIQTIETRLVDMSLRGAQ